MNNLPDRPDFVSDEHLEFLDDLRESGDINMYLAREYILEDFPELSKEEAVEVLRYWMITFGNVTR